MRTRLLAVALLVALPALASAQNRQDLQVNAELRMLEEKIAKIQVVAAQLSESIRAVNKRFDDQATVTQKNFADLQTLIGTLATTVNTVREKLDDNTVRVQELKQELPALRSGLGMVAEQLNTLVALLQPPVNPISAEGQTPPGGGGSSPAGAGAGSGPLGAVRIPDSPNAIYDAAMVDYMSNHLDNAIDGFNEFLQKYPDAPNAAQAQFHIGLAYHQRSKLKEALAAYGKVISNYKTAGDVVQDAYYQQGLCYLDLGQKADARRIFQLIAQMFPGSTTATLAQQKLVSMGAR